MALTVRERVMRAFVAALEALTEDDVYGLSVERNRDAEVTKFPTLVVLDGEAEPDDGFAHGITEYRMPVPVVAFVKADAAGTAEDKVDLLYGLVLQALLADRTLGGLAVDVAEQPGEFERDREAGHPAAGGFRTAFLVRFWTRQGDPITAGP